MPYFLYKNRVNISKASEIIFLKKLALVRLQLQGKILGMLQEQSGWISGGTGENNIKHENSGKYNLQGKAGEEKPEQGLDNSPHVHKKKLWESNQVFLCIPCAVGSLCSRKIFLMKKAFENWRNFFRKAVKSLVPKVFREVFRKSLDRSCRCSPSWELEEGVEQGQPNQQFELDFSIFSLPISHTLETVMIFTCSWESILLCLITLLYFVYC